MLIVSHTPPRVQEHRPTWLVAATNQEIIAQFRARCELNSNVQAMEQTTKIYSEKRHPTLCAGLAEGEIRAVIVSHKGKYKNCAPFILDPIIFRRADYNLGLCTIVGIRYLVLIDPSYKTGVNKTASDLVNEGHPVFGPVIFVMLDHECEVVHMDTAIFKKCALSNLK